VTGFKAFLMRGNLINLAVAVVIGTAFTAVVTAFVADLLTPLIAAVAGKRSFPNLTFTIHHSTFQYGLFINAALSFLIIALVVYWLVVAPTVTLTARLTRKQEATTKDCPECLSTIPIAASRCMYCTVELVTTPTAQAPATFTPTAPPGQPPRSPGQPPRSSGRHSSGNY
jgi:large conductance mechanosensitive channel